MSRTQKYQPYKIIKVPVDARAIFHYDRLDNELRRAAEIASVSIEYGLIFFTFGLGFLPHLIGVLIDSKFWILLCFGIISSSISIVYLIRYFIYSQKSKRLRQERNKYEFDRFLLMNHRKLKDNLNTDDNLSR